MLCDTRDRTCGQRDSGSCIITKHQLIPRNWFKLSCPNTTFLLFDRLPTLPTWLLAIFGCSATWKRSWKGLDLSHHTSLLGTWRPSCTPFAKQHSRNPSNNGGNAGRIVFNHKETTSMGIGVADLQACKCIILDQRTDTFWTGLVYGRTMGQLLDCSRMNVKYRKIVNHNDVEK